MNVEDFRESLTFSGKGSSKNNFLVDMSILDDSETEYISEIYSQESKIFRRAIDSLIDEKNNIWELFNRSTNQKRLSRNITKASIKYNYFNKLERYALLRARNWSNSEREEFFSYRKKNRLK